MLLPSAGLQNKVRKYIEELKIDAVGHITVSLGVAQVLEGEDMKDSIEREQTKHFIWLKRVGETV